MRLSSKPAARAAITSLAVAVAGLTPVLLPGSAQAADPVAADPLASGPYAVSTGYVSAGTISLDPPPISPTGSSTPIDAEVRAEYFHPAGATASDWPVILIQHARGANYDGYDYLGSLLASHGFYVASMDLQPAHDYNALAIDAGDRSVRNEISLAFLDKLKTWNAAPDTTSGGIGSSLVGNLDLATVGVLGHSRGASAAIELPRQAQVRSNPWKISAVFAMSPGPITQLNDDYVIDPDAFANLQGVPFGGLAGTCDGDVGQSHAQNAFARNQFNAGDQNEKTMWVVQGLNHFAFDASSTNDDGTGLASSNPSCARSVANNLRVTDEEQRTIGAGYATAFFRYHLLRDAAFADLISGRTLIAPSMAPASGRPTDELVQVSYAAPASQRQVIYDAESADPLTQGVDGATLVADGLAEYEWCKPVGRLDPATYVYTSGRPYSWYTPTFVQGCPGVGNDLWIADMDSQLQVGWDEPSSLTVTLGAFQRDASKYEELAFRTSVIRHNALNPQPDLTDYVGGDVVRQDFDVTVTDTSGRSTTVAALPYARNALNVPITNTPTPSGAGAPVPNWRKGQNGMSDVSIPVSALTGVDTSSLASIRFGFGGRTASGAVALSDIVYRRAVAPSTTTVAVSGLAASSRFGTAKSASIAVTSARGSAATGSVQVLDGTTFLATVPLSGGAGTATLPRSLGVGAHSLEFAYVPSSSSGPGFVANRTLLTHTVAKARTRIASLRWQKRPRGTTRGVIRIGVRSPDAGIVNAGRVRVTIRNKTVQKAVRRGFVTVKVAKVKPGQHRVRVVYLGTSTHAKSVTRAAQVRVRR